MRKWLKRGAVCMLAACLCLSGCGGTSNEATKKEEQTGQETDTQAEKPMVNPSEEVIGLKAYYSLGERPEGDVLTDESGNGYDGTFRHGTYTVDDGLTFQGGAYAVLPSEIFAGEDTLSISLWVQNFSGNINTSTMFVGTKEAMPVSYWLFNVANPAGMLKSVITDTKNAAAPYNTEVGLSPTIGTMGVAGPYTDMGWNHYVTILTPELLTVYMNGEQVGSVRHERTVSDFGSEIVAYLGKSSYNDPTFTGNMKEVRIYDMELSEAEIKKVYETNPPEQDVVNATESEIFIADRADPFIMKASDGYYYFTASYPMYGGADAEGYDRVILRRAKTLEGLADAEEKVIWDEKESNTAFRFIWAPEIHEIDGKFYVYFAASGQSDNVWDINCHVIACDGTDPYNDTWTDKGKFQKLSDDYMSFTGFSLDMTYFTAGGTHYVAWAQKVGESNVYLATVDEKEPWKLTSKPMLLTKPEYYWERISIPVNEGPAVMVENGTVYLAFSASATGPEYCIGLMSAKEDADLLDINSWTKHSKPLLTSFDLIGEYGPGHNSFVKDENGDWVFVYHSRSETCYKGECGYGHEDPLYDPCRSAHIRKVKWSEDGMPILNQ